LHRLPVTIPIAKSGEGWVVGWGFDEVKEGV